MKHTIDMPVIQSCPDCLLNDKCKKYRPNEDEPFGVVFTCGASDQENNNAFGKMWELVYKTKEENKDE